VSSDQILYTLILLTFVFGSAVIGVVAATLIVHARRQQRRSEVVESERAFLEASQDKPPEDSLPLAVTLFEAGLGHIAEPRFAREIEGLTSRLLRHPNVAQQALGANAAGWWRLPTLETPLLSLMDKPYPASLSAATSLIRIDRTRHTEEVAANLCLRSDWPLPTAAATLAIMPGDAPLPVLQRFTSHESAIVRRRAAALIGSMPSAAASHWLREESAEWNDPEMLLAAMRAFGHNDTEEARITLRFWTQHPDDAVAARAARVLGSTGGDEDEPLLRHLLRTRETIALPVAQAISFLPGGDPMKLSQMAAEESSEVARAALARAVAEEIASQTSLDDLPDNPPLYMLRSQLQSPNWRIRIAAAGRIVADASQWAWIVMCAMRPEWWTQYRAMRRLAERPWIRDQELLDFADRSGKPEIQLLATQALRESGRLA